MANNTNLHKAKMARNDEFYTKLEDIEAEVSLYKDNLRGKVIFCNCDDYRWSNFVKFFKDNFTEYGLSGLLSLNHNTGDGSFLYKFDGESESITHVKAGSFASLESLEVLEYVDVVVTNPPFSLARSFLRVLEEYGKEYLFICPLNAITYPQFFDKISVGGMTTGHHSVGSFITGDGNEKKFGNVVWYTNLPVREKDPIPLTKSYSGREDAYPFYDGFDIINVDTVVDIPSDFLGVMGVPISYLTKHCKSQFDILGCISPTSALGKFRCYTVVRGQDVYRRLLIRRVTAQSNVGEFSGK